MARSGTYCIALSSGSKLPSGPFVGSAGMNRTGTGRLCGVMQVRACYLPSRRWQRDAFLHTRLVDSGLLPFGKSRLGGGARHGGLGSRSVGITGEMLPSRLWLSG